MVRTLVGYTGGTTPAPTYGTMGDHTESIQIIYDPAVISYEALLSVFWEAHSPLRPPWSRQYMSAIYPHDDEQRRVAEASKAARERQLGQTMHTAIEDATAFYRAEDYHQKYRLRSDSTLMEELARMYPDDEDFVLSTAAARMNGALAGYPIQSADLEALGLRPGARRHVEQSQRR